MCAKWCWNQGWENLGGETSVSLTSSIVVQSGR